VKAIGLMKHRWQVSVVGQFEIDERDDELVLALEDSLVELMGVDLSDSKSLLTQGLYPVTIPIRNGE
jgi:hypothetical protein